MTHTHLCRCARSGGGFGGAEARPHFPPDVPLEPVHMHLKLAVDIDARSLDGTSTLTLRATRDAARTLTLDAVGFVDVDVDIDGTWTYDGERIEARLAQGVTRGDEAQITVRWRVVDPPTGLIFGGSTDVWPDGPHFAATDNETERARYWMPCVDHPSVRPTLAFDLTADAALEALANGAHAGRTEHGDGTATTSWRLDVPCPAYLTCVAIGDFTRVDDGEVEGLPIAYFAVREITSEQLKLSFGRTPQMLAWLSEKLGGAPPWGKYYQFAVPWVFGAMENISLVSWDDKLLLDEALVDERGPLFDLVNVHEMAHSWFGDLVVCRDFAHSWLKESWATYMEMVWAREHVSEDEAQLELILAEQAYFAESDEAYARPIVTHRYESSWELFDAHLYPGGARRLEMLRVELGDDVFWDGVRAYLAEYRHQTVETDQFRRAMEQASGRSLVQFFDQWFLRPGYPKLKASWSWDDDAGESVFELEQTQIDDERGIGVFDLDIEVGHVVDGELVTRTVRMRERHAVGRVPGAKRPTQVRVDPHGRVMMSLDFAPGDDLLRAQLTDAPDIRGRILAGHELAKSGRSGAVQAVVDALAGEPYHGVRSMWAAQLASAGSDIALRGLAHAIEHEPDAQALHRMLRTAAKVKHAAVRDAIDARLEGPLGHFARGEAYRALARWRDQAPWSRLVEAARAPGFLGIAQGVALQALGETRQPAAIDTLVAALRPGATPARARWGAVVGLGAAARWARTDAERAMCVEALSDALRDRDHRVRDYAAAALGAARDPSAIPALTSYAQTRPRQEQVAIRAAIRALRAGAGASAKDEAVDRLEDTVRALQEQLRKLEARVVPGSDGAAHE